MSRIGRNPVSLPQGVTFTVSGSEMTAKGPKGTLTKAVPSMVSIQINADNVVVDRVNESKPARARHGLTRSLVQNLVLGVSQGFEKKLEIFGVGYKAESKGKKVVLHLGYSHPIEFEPPAGVEIKVDKTNLTVTGIDKEAVGQVAANLRGFRKPDAYKGKGVRYAGEVIRLKAGKSGK